MFRPAPFLVTLLDRVKAIVRRVARPAAERGPLADVPSYASAAGPVSPALRGLARVWISAKLRALSALMRRIEAGEMPESPTRAPRTSMATASAPAERAPVPPEERLPRGFGWMCALGPNVRRDGAAFAEWLNTPATQAVILAAPEHMARLIGPILSATGERRPHWFPAAPQRARKPRPGRFSTRGHEKARSKVAAGAGCRGADASGTGTPHVAAPAALLASRPGQGPDNDIYTKRFSLSRLSMPCHPQPCEAEARCALPRGALVAAPTNLRFGMPKIAKMRRTRSSQQACPFRYGTEIRRSARDLAARAVKPFA
jgi:hypothetical protein